MWHLAQNRFSSSELASHAQFSPLMPHQGSPARPQFLPRSSKTLSKSLLVVSLLTCSLQHSLDPVCVHNRIDRPPAQLQLPSNSNSILLRPPASLRHGTSALAQAPFATVRPDIPTLVPALWTPIFSLLQACSQLI